jgi:D-alanyl-D-alanine carboxypeptidase
LADEYERDTSLWFPEPCSSFIDPRKDRFESMRAKTGVLLFYLATAASLTQAQSASRLPTAVKAPESSDRIDDYVEAEIRKRHIPGVSIAVVQDGKVVRAKGYGMANVELSVLATENTVYQLASVTKTFTAAAIMMLVEEGKLGLDDKISKRLSDLPAAWENVTVRQLLNHTSGIKSYTSVRDFVKTARKDYTHREILELVAKEPLDFAPGEKWLYNNTGYFVLGMLIEKVTGKTYGEFLTERIFKPLGMTQTRTNDLHAIIPNRAQGYEWNGSGLRNGEYVSPTQPFSAGMLVSSVSDLVKWDAALATEKLLKKSTLEQMWTPTKTSKAGTADYGFGWQVDQVNGHRLIAHGGGIPGFSTQISRFVDDKLSVIVLTNAGNGFAGALAQGIAGRIVPVLLKKADEPIADNDPQSTERFKGLLLRAMKGEADPELFTDEAKKALVPRIREGKAMFAPFGPLKTFQLLERKTTGQGMQLRYRTIFENEALNTTFVLDKAGKIAGLGIRPAE